MENIMHTTELYVLTKMGDIQSPVIDSKGFNLSDKAKFSFEILCSDNSTARINVFEGSYIPHGFYDKCQSVPLGKFMQETAAHPVALYKSAAWQ